MEKISKLTIQRWGNSLAVRIPATVARSAHFSVGQPVEMSVLESAVIVKPVGTPKLTLSQKLALFDPVNHGGEVMSTDRVGVEVM